MPLVYQQNINDHTKVGVWHITEPELFFLKEIEMKQSISHPQKRLQHLAGRYLLKQIEFDFPINEIEIAASKKPYLKGGQFYFSVSHAENYAAVIISQKNTVGIDIELPQSKINTIKDKFLSDSESILLSTLLLDDEHQYTLGWCVKEAIFKWYGEGQVDFKKHICIDSVDQKETHLDIKVDFIKSAIVPLNVSAIFIEGYCLAWVINQA